MQAQGGPSRAELWDKGQQGSPDSYLGLKTSSKSKTKSYPYIIQKKQFSLLHQNLVNSCFYSRLSQWKGEGENEVIVTEYKGEKKPTFEMYIQKKEKIQSTPLHTDYANIQDQVFLSKKTVPSCLGLRNVWIERLM